MAIHSRTQPLLVGAWDGDHVLGQYDGSNFPSLIKSTVGSPSMTVSHTNLP